VTTRAAPHGKPRGSTLRVPCGGGVSTLVRPLPGAAILAILLVGTQ